MKLIALTTPYVTGSLDTVDYDHVGVTNISWQPEASRVNFALCHGTNSAGDLVQGKVPKVGAVIVNNVFSGRIAERDGGRADIRQNEKLKGSGRFADPANGDFSLTDPAWLIDRGAPLKEVTDDFCGSERPRHVTTLGPFQFSADAPGCVVF